MNKDKRPVCKCGARTFPHKRDYQCDMLDDYLGHGPYEGSVERETEDEIERRLDERDRARAINEYNRRGR